MGILGCPGRGHEALLAGRAAGTSVARSLFTAGCRRRRTRHFSADHVFTYGRSWWSGNTRTEHWRTEMMTVERGQRPFWQHRRSLRQHHDRDGA
ncbi:hypothetical protein KCP69_13885 [Salmonella enterica subsp. enterica]|nr:hypothetical protein KCP69_13885 [Salmonella enterica subsp. enterica]